MRIINANIVLENKIIKGYIEFDQKKITKIKAGKCNKSGYDAKGLYLLPAFVDSHTHGGYGFDFNMLANKYDQNALQKYLKQVQCEGVGSILMTTVTASDKDLNAIANLYRVIKTLDINNVIKGWYIEGPYISVIRKGAHNHKLIRSIDLKELNKLKKILPNVTKVLAVAPEYKDNLSKIDKINKDYFVAIGHSDANYDIAMKAFDKKNSKRVIHLYNALPDFNKRTPTILNAIFNRKDLTCELICDQAHVSKETILNTYNILGADQIAIISDSLLTKGLPNGKYKIWNILLQKRGMLDYFPGTNDIAGSNVPFNLQVENFGKITKCSMNEILKVSSLNAAKAINCHKSFGNLIVGAENNFVLINKQYKLIKTFIKGIVL